MSLQKKLIKPRRQPHGTGRLSPLDLGLLTFFRLSSML